MLVGQSVGQFVIEKQLGSGAMGSVYRANYAGDDARLLRELGDARRVALKVIAFGLANNETALARFEREAKILKQLKHPHIVRLYGSGRYRDTPFFVMEYIDGQSMDRLLARRDRLSWEEVIEYGKQLCSALQHAHEKGIIHRDLKPSNLMLTKDGKLKLTDFGIAKDVDVTALTGANNTIGTASYMSPEQCKGEKVLTAKSDLYSLGIVFYELLTGTKPFQAESSVDLFMMHVQGSFIRPSKLVPEMPIWLDTLVCQLLEKKPEHRPRDAEMVRLALEEVAEKVATQKSVGAEIANAKVGDRVHLTDELSDDDRAAGKTIKAGMKKKKLRKKSVPIHQRGWFVLVACLLLIGAFGYVIHLMTRPDSPETLVAKIDKEENVERKRTLIKEYLEIYGKQTDEATERVRQLFRGEAAREVESVMLNRHRMPKMKIEPEAFQPDAYSNVMKAFDLEADGNLVAARQIWKELNEKYSNESDPNAHKLGWLGAKRDRDMQLLDRKVEEIRKKILEDDRDEKERKFSDDIEKEVSLILRCEALGDWMTARDRWQKLRDSLAKKSDAPRVWLLFSAYRFREIDGLKKAFTSEERMTHLQQKIDQAQLELTDSQPVIRRNARNLLRDIRDIYSDEIQSLRKVAGVAEELLKKAKLD
jgi:serine/threonine-protein kinase